MKIDVKVSASTGSVSATIYNTELEQLILMVRSGAQCGEPFEIQAKSGFWTVTLSYTYLRYMPDDVADRVRTALDIDNE